MKPTRPTELWPCGDRLLRNARFGRTIPQPSEPSDPATPSDSSMTDDPAAPAGAITQWLLDWGRSDKQGLDQMLPVVYQELHRLASHYLSREATGHTLQPTALVHEAYLRLVDQRRVDWRNRAQFLGLAASMMRRILVNHARDRAARKRGGDPERVSLSLVESPSGQPDIELIALEDALQRLAEVDVRKSRVVELKFFGGLTIEEIAEVLQISGATVEREWAFARAWLLQAIEGAGAGNERGAFRATGGPVPRGAAALAGGTRGAARDRLPGRSHPALGGRAPARGPRPGRWVHPGARRHPGGGWPRRTSRWMDGASALIAWSGSSGAAAWAPSTSPSGPTATSSSAWRSSSSSAAWTPTRCSRASARERQILASLDHPEHRPPARRRQHRRRACPTSPWSTSRACRSTPTPTSSGCR